MKLTKVLLAATPLLALVALPALGQDAVAPEAVAAVPVPDKGDTTWMLISTVLVLLMTVPGLALFYGGLVRAKNMLSVLMQVFTITAVVMIIWVVYGYSLAFTDGGSMNSYVGGLSKAFLSGVTDVSLSETFSKGVYIPELVFVLFQMTFAAITPVPDRRRFRGTRQVLGGHALRHPVGHLRLLPDRPHGLVLGRPERRRRADRPDLRLRRDRLRRRHRGAHQLRASPVSSAA